MILVNSLGEIVEFDTSDWIYRGATSKIYEVDESTLVKIHNLVHNDRSISMLAPSVFDLLKTIKHKNFINLIERYHRVPQTSENVEAYTYEHIKDGIYNPLYLAMTDFMVDQFYNIWQLFEIFSSEGIAVSDTNVKNSVLLKERIVIIDPDFFDFLGDKEGILIRNRIEFVEFMKSFFDPAFCGYSKIEKLFDGMMEENEPLKILAQRLKGYKRPYDYFLDK